MLEGLWGLVGAMCVMFVGFSAVLIGAVLPYWQRGNGLDIGLFYTCQDGDCENLQFHEDTQYVVAVFIVLGLVMFAVSISFTIYVCIQRCKGKQLMSFAPGCVSMAAVIGDTFILTGAVLFCISTSDKDGQLCLGVCPWLVIVGGVVLGLSSYFLPHTITDKTKRVDVVEKNNGQKEQYNQNNMRSTKKRHSVLSQKQAWGDGKNHQPEADRRKSWHSQHHNHGKHHHQQQQLQQQQQYNQSHQRLKEKNLQLSDYHHDEPLQIPAPYRKYSVPTIAAPTPTSFSYEEDYYAKGKLGEPPEVFEPLACSYSQLNPAYPPLTDPMADMLK